MNIYLIQQELDTTNANYHIECEYIMHRKEFTNLEFENMCNAAKLETSGEVVDVSEYLCDEYGFTPINDHIKAYHQYE